MQYTLLDFTRDVHIVHPAPRKKRPPRPAKSRSWQIKGRIKGCPAHPWISLKNKLQLHGSHWSKAERIVFAGQIREGEVHIYGLKPTLLKLLAAPRRVPAFRQWSNCRSNDLNDLRGNRDGIPQTPREYEQIPKYQYQNMSQYQSGWYLRNLLQALISGERFVARETFKEGEFSTKWRSAQQGLVALSHLWIFFKTLARPKNSWSYSKGGGCVCHVSSIGLRQVLSPACFTLERPAHCWMVALWETSGHF